MYYLLGGNNEQNAVYHGQQTSGTGICGDTGRRVYLYPTEYLTHGIAYTGVPEDVSQVITSPGGGKEYRIADHLASLRVSVTQGGAMHYDYDPWGNSLPVTVAPERRGYNDREKDRETGMYNLGVRSMGEGDHFTSIDPLWEKTPGMSPYVYANDNPLRFTDPEGMQGVEMVPGRLPDNYHMPGVLPYPNVTPEAFRILLHDIGAAIQRVFFSPHDSPGSSGTNAPANSDRVENSPLDHRFTVRRFVSKEELKEIRKNGMKYDKDKFPGSGGIPTTTRNFNPRNRDEVKSKLGAPIKNTEYWVDLDATNIPRGADKKTKAGLPEYSIQGDVPKSRIINFGRVPK